jgi:glycosyltransferase involved in cell wall biosynthesis
MAAGLPLMATRLFCHKDVVGDDKYVFWADNADEQGLVKTLRQVWQQRSNLAQMGSRAAAAAPAWTWHESALKLKTALETGLKRNPE